jgi:hypothetical protein
MSDCHTTSTLTTSSIPLPARGWTPGAMARFLDHLSVKGNVRAACARVGLSAEAAYRLRRRDPLFARGWAAAQVLARDNSEQELATRALDGVEQPVFYRGERIGTRCHYDTRLLLAHLARLDRQVAQNTQALADAGRFDEMLARILGERFPEELAVGDEMLPGTRAEILGEAAAEAQDRLLYDAADEDAYDGDAGDYGDAYDDDLYDDAEEEEEEEDAFAAAGEAARAAAAVQWDGWFAHACAVVDRLTDPAPVQPALLQPAPDLSAAIAAAARGVAGMIAAEQDFTPRTVSTVSTSALAHALHGPARGFRLEGWHPAQRMGNRVGRR